MAAIGGTYPTTAASVAEWLSALNLSKHEAALTGAGITQVSQLMGLTDEQLIAADIRLVGQRKRLIAASRELTGQSMEVEAPAAAPGPPAADGAMDVDATPGTAVAAGSRTPPPSSSGAAGGSEDPPLADPQGKRFNSTSSIYINSTIIKPDIDEIIFCVAVVIHDRIEQGEQMGVEIRQRFHYFSEENNPLYADPVPQQEKKAKREIPTEETIFHTIRSVRAGRNSAARNFRRRAIFGGAPFAERLPLHRRLRCTSARASRRSASSSLWCTSSGWSRRRRCRSCARRGARSCSPASSSRRKCGTTARSTTSTSRSSARCSRSRRSTTSRRSSSS